MSPAVNGIESVVVGSQKPVGGPIANGKHQNPLNADGSPYGFPGAKFDVAFCPIMKPEDNPSRSRYRGFHPSEQVLPKGNVKEPGMRALPCDIQFDRDVAVKMRDGATLYTDNFRPVGDEKVPAILCWRVARALLGILLTRNRSPYGKSGTGDFP
jgi:hypothetical protein